MSRRHGPCGWCGKDPAEGSANYWTNETGTIWLCHSFDRKEASCYMRYCWKKTMERGVFADPMVQP